MKRTPIALLAGIFSLFLLAGCDGTTGAVGSAGPTGATGATGSTGATGGVNPTTSVETCVGCHGSGTAVPVGDITTVGDAHYINTTANGLMTSSGYRQLNLALTSVDVTGSNVIIEFTATDELGGTVADLYAADGRFTIAKLVAGSGIGEPNDWSSLMTTTEDPGSVGTGPGTSTIQATYERFTTSAGVFAYLGTGNYRYTSSFDPSSSVASGDTLRVAIQMSASDIPPGNGWCDFDANLSSANNCTSAVTVTKDVVQTATCNGCHGTTTDTQLGIHGGGRTDVEYCVTCHNPDSTDANSGESVDMKVMIHKIHRGSSLSQSYTIWGYGDAAHDYSKVSFTKEIDNCTNCHTGGGADVDNWSTLPTMAACGSCHDDIDWTTGANHAGGGATSNGFCAICHPQAGALGAGGGPPFPVETVHQGVARATEAALYAGGSNGYSIDAVSFDSSTDVLTIDYSVTKSATAMDLAADSEWTDTYALGGGGASRLNLSVAWDTSDYNNNGSGATPGKVVDINGLDIAGGTVTAQGGGVYRVTTTLPSSASDTVTVTIDGHPAADLDSDGTYSDRIPVKSVFQDININGGRAVVVARRAIVDVSKCNKCHDAAGQGISLHGSNRTGEVQVCVVCHNPDATDINRRPSDPTTTADGKVEESIDMKRMIHQIHSGSDLVNGVVIYGYGSAEHDYSTVGFTGNRKNCETCHYAGTYDTLDAANSLASTISTGTDVADPDDDLNISPTAATCSSCHDDDKSTDHMELHGASFSALDDDIL